MFYLLDFDNSDKFYVICLIQQDICAVKWDVILRSTLLSSSHMANMTAVTSNVGFWSSSG